MSAVNRENGRPWADHSLEELAEIMQARINFYRIFKDKHGVLNRYPSSGQALDVLAELLNRAKP